MGAEREETNPKRVGTEPGLGGTPSAGSGQPAVAASAPDDDGPAAVDFDALHAALGDPLDFDDLPPAASELNGDESDEPGMPERVGESSGRSSATYSSARPHTIPPSYSPNEDLNVPPVIVASEDTVPSAPPQMTVPVGHAQQPLGHTPQSGVPFVGSNPVAAGRAPSGPQHLGPLITGPHAASAQPSYSKTPQAFPVQPRVPAVQMTMRMPERPLLNPRHGKTPTLVVRPRGPSAKQKLIAFMAMLLLVTACGIAVIIWRKPRWLGLDPSVPLTPTSSASTGVLAPSDTSGAGTAPTASTMPASTASATASASASASVRVMRPRPPAPAAPREPH
jgi:hypothetical protein